MEARITTRSATSYTIEVEIPYEFTSMLEAETRIQEQVNKVGVNNYERLKIVAIT